MMVVSKSWINPIAIWFPDRKEGIGQFHIICPIEKYIRGRRKHREAIRRFRRTGVSLSFKMPSSEAWVVVSEELPELFGEAPYPASSTAAMMSCAVASPSTPMEFVSRLTEQEVTPATFDTAFSTRALQAAQLIPVTLYCFIEASIFKISR